MMRRLIGPADREERAQSLRDRQMCDYGVAEHRVRQVCQHRRLHRGHHLARFGTNHRETADAVVTADKNLHETECFIGRLRPQHGAHRQPGDARSDTLPLRFALAQPDMGKGRVGEHAIGDQPIARGAVPPGQVVPDDARVVDRGHA